MLDFRGKEKGFVALGGMTMKEFQTKYMELSRSKDIIPTASINTQITIDGKQTLKNSEIMFEWGVFYDKIPSVKTQKVKLEM